eukprot:jgi/Chlat1/1587/Chrsp124S01863
MALMRVVALMLFLLVQPLAAAATAVVAGRLFCDKCNSGIQVPISRGKVVLNCTTYVTIDTTYDDDYYYASNPVVLNSSQSTLTNADGTFSFDNVYMTDQYVASLYNSSVPPFSDYYRVFFPVHCNVYVPASAPCTAAAITYPISNNVDCTSRIGSPLSAPYEASPSLASVFSPQDASTYALGNFCLAPAQTPSPPTCPFPSAAPSLRRLFYTRPVPAGSQASDEFGRRLEIAFWNDATGRSVTVLEACTLPYSPHSVEAVDLSLSKFGGYASTLQVVGENLYFLGRNCSSHTVGVFRKPAAWHPDRYQRNTRFAQPVLINANYTYYHTFAVDVDALGKEYVYFSALSPIGGGGNSFVTHFAVQTATWRQAVLLEVYDDYEYEGVQSPGAAWVSLYTIQVDSAATPHRVWWGWRDDSAAYQSCSVSYGDISPDHRSITNQQLWDYCVDLLSIDQVHGRLFVLHDGYLLDGPRLSVFNISGEGPVPILSNRPLGISFAKTIAYYAPANYLFFSVPNWLNFGSSDATAYVELSQLVGKAELDACLAVSGSSDEDQPCAATGVATSGNRPVHIVTPPPGGSIALFY